VEEKRETGSIAFLAPISTVTGSESGQAILEYILLLSIILGLSGAIYAGVTSSRDKMWKHILCEVSAACPDCQSTQSAKNAFPKSGVTCKN